MDFYNNTSQNQLTRSTAACSHAVAFVALATTGLLLLSGCATSSPKWIDQPWAPVNFEASNEVKVEIESNAKPALLAKQEQQTELKTEPSLASPSKGRGLLVDNNVIPASYSQYSDTQKPQVVRGQDGGYPLTSGQPGSYVPPATPYGGSGQFTPQGQTYAPQQSVYQNQTQPAQPQQQYGGGYPLGGQGQFGQPRATQAFQVPAPAQLPVPNTGAPNQIPTYFPPGNAPVGNAYSTPNYADLDVLVREAQSGKVTFGAAYNSNSGLVGQIIIDERNFDILNFPKNIQDIVDGTAFKGAGQGFRLELVPGNEVQRYMASFTEPYLFQSNVSFSASGYYFDRRYLDWDEQRLGGRVNLGYRLTPDLSLSVGLRMENVNIHDPRVNTSPALNSVLGDNALFLAQFSLINDTRDHPFMASSGSYLELSYFQGFGDFDYPRGELDYRRYFLISERPDLSGRHTLSIGTKLGFSGASTPLFENYHPGGFSTMRGFDFRGISPVEGGVQVGGRFQWLNTVEYTFPLTPDDLFKGVLFCDFGTVERDIEFNSENFRVAPGFGFRVHMPVGGAGGAPLAFDFAFPVSDAEGDDRQTFSFYMSAIR